MFKSFKLCCIIKLIKRNNNENDKNFIQSHYNVTVLLNEEKKMEGHIDVCDNIVFEDIEEDININDI